MKNTLVFPNRGDPPPDQPGYTRDPGNPYVFHMTWIPCVLRVIVIPCQNCPGQTELKYCDRFDKPAEQNECNTCGGMTFD
jgi:hypothetical protein